MGLRVRRAKRIVAPPARRTLAVVRQPDVNRCQSRLTLGNRPQGHPDFAVLVGVGLWRAAPASVEQDGCSLHARGVLVTVAHDGGKRAHGLVCIRPAQRPDVRWYSLCWQGVYGVGTPSCWRRPARLRSRMMSRERRWGYHSGGTHMATRRTYLGVYSRSALVRRRRRRHVRFVPTADSRGMALLDAGAPACCAHGIRAGRECSTGADLADHFRLVISAVELPGCPTAGISRAHHLLPDVSIEIIDKALRHQPVSVCRLRSAMANSTARLRTNLEARYVLAVNHRRQLCPRFP